MISFNSFKYIFNRNSVSEKSPELKMRKFYSTFKNSMIHVINYTKPRPIFTPCFLNYLTKINQINIEKYIQLQTKIYFTFVKF